MDEMIFNAPPICAFPPDYIAPPGHQFGVCGYGEQLMPDGTVRRWQCIGVVPIAKDPD